MRHAKALVAALLAMQDEVVPELAWQMGRPVRYGAGELRGFAERARYMIGIAEVLTVAYGGSQMRDFVVYGLMILILLLRPQGLLGGARSGKSRFAEAMLVPAAAERVYIATAQVFDDEMRGEVVGGPPLAQRGCIGPHLQEEIAQRGALGLLGREGGHRGGP